MLATTDLDLERLPDTLNLWFRNWTMEGFFQSVSVGSAGQIAVNPEYSEYTEREKKHE